MPNTVRPINGAEESDENVQLIPVYVASSISGGVDFSYLFRAIWQGRWLTIVIMAVVGALAVWLAVTMPNVYRSEAIVSPTEESTGGGLAALAGQFGGLASLAGVNLGAKKVSRSVLAMEIINSRKFIVDFVHKYDLKVSLLAARSWDPESDELLFDVDVYDVKTQSWTDRYLDGADAEPSDWVAYKSFIKLLSIGQDKPTGLVTIGVEHVSPVIAQSWAMLIVDEINENMRSRDIKKASSSIEYLKLQLLDTSLVDMKNVFYNLIEEQTKTIMLANVRDDYIFTTIDPAVVPKEKSKPQRLVVVVAALMLGFMLGAMVSILRYYSKRK